MYQPTERGDSLPAVLPIKEELEEAIKPELEGAIAEDSKAEQKFAEPAAQETVKAEGSASDKPVKKKKKKKKNKTKASGKRKKRR